MQLPWNRRRATSEARDPQVATRTTGSTSVGLAALTDYDDSLKIRKQWLCSVYVDAAIRAIATDLARLKFRAGPDPDRPEEFNTAAPLALLLGPPPGGPNPVTSARTMWTWSVAQRMGLGRFAWELELQGNTPVRLWPLSITRLEPQRSKGGSEWFSGYKYASGDGGPRTLSTDQVLYSWVPHPDDFRQHYSVLDAAALDIEVMVSQDRYDVSFIRNDAKPATVVVHEQFDDIEERDKWRAGYTANHGGPDKAGRTLFTETIPGGASPKDALQIMTVGLSQRESQALERYAAKLRSVCVALGVPLSRLGDASARTFSNAGAELKMYWQNTILSLATDLQDVINMNLAPRVGEDIGWWDLTEVEELRPDPMLAFPTVVEAKQADIITVEESRELIGLDPNGGPEQTPDEPTAPPQLTIVPPPDTPDVPTPTPTAEAKAAHRTAHREQRRRAKWRSVDSKVAGLEQPFEKAMAALFGQQRKSVLDRLTGNRGIAAHRKTELRAGAIFDKQWWTAKTAADTEAQFAAITTVAGTDLTDDVWDEIVKVYGDAGLRFDISAPHVDAFIRTRAHQLAGHVTATTYRAIQEQLVEGVTAGEAIPELAKRIEDLFDVTWAGRAEMVARTEVVSAYNGAAVTTALGYGPEVVAGLEWIATLDSRVRPHHEAADGQTIRTGDVFRVGGHPMAYPGDPNAPASEVVRCRCTLGHLTPDEFADRGVGVPILTYSRARVEYRSLERLLVDVELGRVSFDDVLAEVVA